MLIATQNNSLAAHLIKVDSQTDKAHTCPQDNFLEETSLLSILSKCKKTSDTAFQKAMPLLGSHACAHGLKLEFHKGRRSTKQLPLNSWT